MVDYANVDRAMRGLKMRTELTDATSRVFDLVHTMHHRLEKLSMQFMADDEQKRVIGYLTAALAPAAFKTRVLESQSRNSNKYLRSDLTKFVACLHEKTESFMSWEDFTSNDRLAVAQFDLQRANLSADLARRYQSRTERHNGKKVVSFNSPRRGPPSQSTSLRPTRSPPSDPEILPARRAALVPGAPARRTPAGVNTSGPPHMILSRHVMHSLGFSLPSLLVAARDRQHVWDMAHLRQGSLPLAAVALASEVSFSPPAHVVPARSTSPSPPVDHSPDIVTDNSDIVDFPPVKPPEDVTVRELLAKRVIEARAQGMPEEALGRLEDLLLHYEDVFRLSFGSDPPVRVPPLEVKLRSGATPVRCATSASAP
ncbi:unnamed protein product [Aphanomyces euteiches]